MEAHNIDNLKEKSDSQINSFSKNEFPEFKKEIPKYKRKKLILDYATRGLDFCGVWKQKYNLGDRIPRILVHCGHTFCTNCLIKFHHADHIRCPYCRKLINNIDSYLKLNLCL